jgi:ribosome-binding factor A
MSRGHHSGGEPSQRMLRVGELIRHTLSDLLARGAVRDSVLEGHVITVPDVRMSPDLKLATVYIMPLGGKDVDGVLAALDRHKKFLRGEIAARINLKFAPEVRFRADQSFDCGTKIDALLDSPQVKRDLVIDPDKR